MTEELRKDINITVTETNDRLSTRISNNRERLSPASYILRLEDGTFYVGSSGGVAKRIQKHKNMLINGTHDCVKLQSAFNESGPKVSIEVTYVDSKESALKAEQDLLNLHAGDSKLSNTAMDAEFPGKGRVLNEKQIQAIKDAHTGKVVSEETRKKLSEANKGKVISDETRQKLREANLGKTTSEETREKLRQALLGHVVSSETAKKISDAKKGKGFPKEAFEASLEKRCVNVVVDGVTYSSYTEAAKALSVTDVTIRNRVKNSNFPSYQLKADE